ncbi:aldolase catalytic domain-containing protein [Campylobacter upsaliensis]|uniref:aldolase catalytic domain-containing protein n=1 Tax=Campylobacter upsaliensis TaxID=28080 RepID=UPI00004B31D7|nr:aldolase catalytic domain-containing protein [Campylobacter upsaliensis]EAL53141.1 4-hydroxy-2-ketovalerate aldolase, putative [Campylobacter upsaliensis RM3195]MCR2110339.1 aldolase catalytic domain-containing protein [Campylobacter upsaliensis]MCR2113996.1 aldolase catalytic domain-containing protein [Campylobacter upsaliensis]MCR2115933.1 aldolase catalytic domain-containing protein [Campylobacter upsaliensis]MCR2121177.1 aldolase catalytic domain-containing protein [Campylobacter upsali
MNIQILDCTLRDGSHINNGKFGKEKIRQIITGLIEANIDIIEVGLLQNHQCGVDFSIFNSIDFVDQCLSSIEKKNSKFSLMLRTDRVDFNKLAKSPKVDFIRIALYQEHLNDIKRYGEKAKELGYEIIFNPIAITKYSPNEIQFLIKTLEELKPYGISLVDTFGSFTLNEFEKVLKIFDKNLSPNITLGIHLHQNLNLALSLAAKATKLIINRDLIIDSSLSGMGRVPGNLQSELFANYLNQNFNHQYNIEKLLSLTALIEEFKILNRWGYNPIYMYSASLNIDRTYPEFFEKMGFCIENNLNLQKICKEKGIGSKFNEEEAQKIINSYN